MKDNILMQLRSRITGTSKVTPVRASRLIHSERGLETNNFSEIDEIVNQVGCDMKSYNRKRLRESLLSLIGQYSIKELSRIDRSCVNSNGKVKIEEFEKTLYDI